MKMGFAPTCFPSNALRNRNREHIEVADQDSGSEPQKSGGKSNDVMTRKAKWVKELFGLPTYFLATMALLKISNGNHLLIVVIGLIPFVVTYNLLYEYLFPGHAFNGQWFKGAFLIVGQILFWSLIFKFLI